MSHCSLSCVPFRCRSLARRPGQRMESSAGASASSGLRCAPCCPCVLSRPLFARSCTRWDTQVDRGGEHTLPAESQAEAPDAWVTPAGSCGCEVRAVPSWRFARFVRFASADPVPSHALPPSADGSSRARHVGTGSLSHSGLPMQRMAHATRPAGDPRIPSPALLSTRRPAQWRQDESTQPRFLPR